jgi:hypothetical protein
MDCLGRSTIQGRSSRIAPVYFIRFFVFEQKGTRLKNGQLGKRENHTTTNLPGQELLMLNIVAY